MNQKQTNRFTRLYSTYYQYVFSLCIKYTKNDAIAKDLTHDTFLKVHHHLGKFKRQSKYSTWIYRIAVNCCLDHLRNTKRRLLLLEEPKNHLWDQVHQTETETFSKAILRHELNRFPKTTQEVLYMRYVLGLNQSEIANKLGVSRVAITKRLQNYHRKRQKNKSKKF